MKTKFITTPHVWTLLLLLQITTICGCGFYEDWGNDAPEISSFTVPNEVQYGETVEFRVTAFDPEDDTITYAWDVSEGILKNTTESKVEWTAPSLPDDEISPPRTVTVSLLVRDGGEKEASRSENIVVYSKAYEVGNGLKGIYELVRAEVNGEVEEALSGTMRLTTTTYTRQLGDGTQFFSGSYQLVEPFSNNKGTINWYPDGIQQLSVSTYTWDGQLLVIYWADTSTKHVYEKKN